MEEHYGEEQHYIMGLPELQAWTHARTIHKAAVGTSWTAIYSGPDGTESTTIVVLKHEPEYTILRKTTVETPRYSSVLKTEYSETYKLLK